ncbi:Ankyrin repeat domain-containing protein 50 [Exaiptasia diaphana]|nr:Ankyrin repeat domain-containing protein 50 [Exaiptasia diaphana]
MYAIAYPNENTALAIMENSKDLDLNAVDDQGQTALIKAAIRGMTTIADALIRLGTVVNIRDKEGKTALMHGLACANENTALSIMENCKDLNLNTVDNQGQTALMYAIARANENTALLMIENSKDLNLNAVDNQGQTSLMKAVFRGMTTFALALIKRGADVNMKDKEGSTALMYAMMCGWEDTALALIKHSIDLDLNIADNKGRTALMKAVIKGMTEVALALIKGGASINKVDDDGTTALMFAVRLGEEDIALSEAIIENSNELDLNMADNEGRTALMKAVMNGMTEVALHLIKHGAEVSKKDKKYKTALIYAISSGQENTALAIFEYSKELDLNITDNEGQTALMKAAHQGMTEVALALIKHGADANKKDNENKTALMHAVTCMREKNTALSIIEHSKELDLDISDKNEETALMKAVFRGMTEVALALIKHGADVNRADREGKTALMFIGLSDHIVSGFDSGKLTHALIKSGAEVDQTDFKENTALMYNVRYEASVKALMQYSQGKALVNQRNSDGRTALYYAILCNKKSVQILLENGAKHRLTDHYNASALTYYIHYRIDKLESTTDIPLFLDDMDDTFSLFEEGEDVSKSIINAAFCKCPQFFLKFSSAKEAWEIVSGILLVAAEKQENDKKQVLNELGIMASQEMDMTNFLNFLTKLIGIVDDPNIGDQQGNGVLHYITLLALRGYLSPKDVSIICGLMKEIGFITKRENYKHETLLIFALSNAIKFAKDNTLHVQPLMEICTFLLKRGYLISKDESQNGESVFHLIIHLLTIGVSREKCQESLLSNVVRLLELFSQHRSGVLEAVNKHDHNLNTPLHLWASISPHSNAGDSDETASTPTKLWQEFSSKVFRQLCSCGAVLYLVNKDKETPLHMCRTWTNVKILVNAGASTKAIDSKGRSPLLSAAQNFLFLENPGLFYPDISQREVPTFWKTACGMGFDLWTFDNDGNSIMSNVLRGKSFELANLLIEIVCENSETLSDETLVGVMNAICRDNSIETTWKRILVERFLNHLKSTRRSLDMRLPFRSCCMNIIYHDVSITKGSEEVHYKIAKQLLRYGVPGESCLDIAEVCPTLQDLLSTPIATEERPLVIPWTSHSEKHKAQLSEVARGLNCIEHGPYWYHERYIGRGAFGKVFVGIHKIDSMEVAIKRVEYDLQDGQEDIREIRNFAFIHNFNHIVRYLTFSQKGDFTFIVMELMEGNLDEYCASALYDRRKTKMLCQQVALGLEHLHEQKLIHRDLKPSNILFRTNPELCVKIADFGLSRHSDVNASFTVMITGAGTRGWIAPEVSKSANHEFSSDVFSLGLIFHYIMSDRRHPFDPADCTEKSEKDIFDGRQANISNANAEGWNYTLNPEASNLLSGMLRIEMKERPTASMLLDHPFFWTKEKKLDFLYAVGNQDEFECPRAKRTVPLTMVEQDLEKEFAIIVKFGKWNDSGYTQTSVILNEMKKPIKRSGRLQPVRTNYDFGSAVELVRFIRNAKAHVSEPSRPSIIRKQVLEAVFLNEFPDLVLQVLKAVINHGWDIDREEIKYALGSDITRMWITKIQDVPLVIPWIPVSKRYENMLAKVARRQNCKVQGQYWYRSEPIGFGAYGLVFVGIHKKDGMEVAIKAFNYSHIDRAEDLRVIIRKFTSLRRCEYIIRYMSFLESTDFLLIIMELMEGNLHELFTSVFYDQTKTTILCQHVALGLNYLHENRIIHRNLSPNKILYKTYPELCLKIAGFGLSHRPDINASFTVMDKGHGTTGWIAPEVMKSAKHEYSMSSDVFSLGLIFHYILSNKKHPFSPADCTGKSDYEINIATQGNILKNDMEGWNKSLDPESSHRIKGMLNCTNEKERPIASKLLHHPMFWSKKKKLDFLSAVGNQEEVKCPRAKRTVPLTMVEQDLEDEFATIAKFGKWDDPRYTQTSVILNESKVRTNYDFRSSVDLVRFIRNAMAHVSVSSRSTVIRTQILKDAVFLDEFPNLAIEVFKAVTAHGWDVSREEIKHVLEND